MFKSNSLPEGVIGFQNKKISDAYGWLHEGYQSLEFPTEFQQDTRYNTGLTVPLSPDDEFAFGYDDPVLTFDWRLRKPHLSAKDESTGRFEHAVEQYVAVTQS